MKFVLAVDIDVLLADALSEFFDDEFGTNDEVQNDRRDAAEDAVRLLTDEWCKDGNIRLEFDTAAGTVRLVRPVVTDAPIETGGVPLKQIADEIRSALSDLEEAQSGRHDDPRDPAFLVGSARKQLDALLDKLPSDD